MAKMNGCKITPICAIMPMNQCKFYKFNKFHGDIIPKLWCACYNKFNGSCENPKAIAQAKAQSESQAHP